MIASRRNGSWPDRGDLVIAETGTASSARTPASTRPTWTPARSRCCRTTRTRRRGRCDAPRRPARRRRSGRRDHRHVRASVAHRRGERGDRVRRPPGDRGSSWPPRRSRPDARGDRRGPCRRGRVRERARHGQGRAGAGGDRPRRRPPRGSPPDPPARSCAPRRRPLPLLAPAGAARPAHDQGVRSRRGEPRGRSRRRSKRPARRRRPTTPGRGGSPFSSPPSHGAASSRHGGGRRADLGRDGSRTT